MFSMVMVVHGFHGHGGSCVLNMSFAVLFLHVYSWSLFYYLSWWFMFLHVLVVHMLTFLWWFIFMCFYFFHVHGGLGFLTGSWCFHVHGGSCGFHVFK